MQIAAPFPGAMGTGPLQPILAEFLGAAAFLFLGAQTSLEGVEVRGYSPAGSSPAASS